MAIDSKAKRHAALLDQDVLFPDGDLTTAQDRAWMLQHYVDPTGAEPPPFVGLGGSIHDELNAELYFSESGVASTENLVGFNVALAGRPYVIDVRQYQRSTLPSQAPQQDTGAEPTELSMSREGFWTREQIDWRHGAGQRFFDAEGSDRARFLSSKGAYVWDPYQLSMLPDTEQKLTSSETNVDVFEVGGLLYLVDGNFLRFTADPTVEMPVFTPVNFTNDITDTTTDGDRIYVATGAGNVLQVVDVGLTTVTTLGTATPDIIEFANGRLVAAEGNELYEVGATGTVTAIRTDPRDTWVWTAIAGHPEAIFAAGTSGVRSEFYAIGLVDTSTALGAPVFAGHLPFTETARCLATYADVVVIGTNKGVRVAPVDQGALNYGERIDVPGGVDALAPSDRFCWFTWSNYDNETSGLGRMDLSVSTSEATFVPAWASDLMARDTTGTVQGVAIHGDRRYFVIAGSGLWGETIYRVPTAELDTGQVRYSVLAAKLFTSVELRTEPLEGLVGADATFADGSTRPLGIATNQGSTSSVLADAQGSGLSMSLDFTLIRDIDDPRIGPTVRGWVLSALPRPKRVTEFIVPIILKSLVTNLVNTPTPFDPYGEVQYLEGLASSAELVTWQEGKATYTVRVDSVAISDQSVRSWSDEHGLGTWFEAVVFVRLLSKES